VLVKVLYTPARLRFLTIVSMSGSPIFNQKKRKTRNRNLLPFLFIFICTIIFATQGKGRDAAPHPAIGKSLAGFEDNDKRQQYLQKEEEMEVNELEKEPQEEGMEVKESDNSKQEEGKEVKELKKELQEEWMERQEEGMDMKDSNKAKQEEGMEVNELEKEEKEKKKNKPRPLEKERQEEGKEVNESDKATQEDLEVQEKRKKKKKKEKTTLEVKEMEMEAKESRSLIQKNVTISISAADMLTEEKEVQNEHEENSTLHVPRRTQPTPATDMNLPPGMADENTSQVAPDVAVEDGMWNLRPPLRDEKPTQVGPCLKNTFSYYPLDDIDGEERTVEKDIHACNARCAEVPACAYITYWLLDGGCHLSSSQAKLRRPRIEERTVAASVNCPSLEGWVEPELKGRNRDRTLASALASIDCTKLNGLRLYSSAQCEGLMQTAGRAGAAIRSRLGAFPSSRVFPPKRPQIPTRTAKYVFRPAQFSGASRPGEQRANPAKGERIIEADKDMRFAGIPTRADTAILVLSARNHGPRRDMIRQTWAAGHSNVYFIVGDTGCRVPLADRHPGHCYEERVGTKGESQLAIKHRKSRSLRHQAEELQMEHALSKEQAKSSDLILVPMVDVYIGLPRKLKEAYRWALNHTNASWFVKTDDDSMVRVGNLEKMLSLYTPRWHVLGRLARDWAVIREGKNAEHHYSPETYPVFPVGAAGHVVSRDIGELIVSADLFEYQGEDTSIGIWLQTSDVRFNVTWVDCRTNFLADKQCVPQDAVMIGHDVTVHEMNACFSEWEGKKILKLKFSPALGDQLFQWASLQGIAHSTGMAPCTAGGKSLKRTIGRETGLPHGCPTLEYLIVNEPGFAKHEPFVTGDHHTEIRSTSRTGYLQSFRYFSNISSIIRETLTPSSRDVQNAAIKEISNYLGTVTVGIYVESKVPDHLGFPGVQYFNASMNYFRSKYLKPVFLLGSNDINWCSQQSIFMAADVKFVHEYSDPLEAFSLAVLSYCDHMILSVGSLGWWSAWLGAYGKGGDVIYNDDEFILTHEANQGQIVKDDYYPKEWKGMLSNGTWA
ncbi:hypothetical protein CYMTET_44929, partial [Cymbomonas tetramitiformis]